MALSPEQEQSQLAAHYVSRGLSPDLAATVAAELSRNDALGAQIDIEPDLGSGRGAEAAFRRPLGGPGLRSRGRASRSPRS